MIRPEGVYAYVGVGLGRYFAKRDVGRHCNQLDVLFLNCWIEFMNREGYDGERRRWR